MKLKKYLRQTATTQAEFARRIGVTQGLVNQWLSGKTRITAERAVQIESATGGHVTRQDLRPDIFGDVCHE